MILINTPAECVPFYCNWNECYFVSKTTLGWSSVLHKYWCELSVYNRIMICTIGKYFSSATLCSPQSQVLSKIFCASMWPFFVQQGVNLLSLPGTWDATTGHKARMLRYIHPIRSGVVNWFALFGAVDEPLASCSVVHVEVNVYKRQLVCKFDIMDIIFLLILWLLYHALYHICIYQ